MFNITNQPSAMPRYAPGRHPANRVTSHLCRRRWRRRAPRGESIAASRRPTISAARARGHARWSAGASQPSWRRHHYYPGLTGARLVSPASQLPRPDRLTNRGNLSGSTVKNDRVTLAFCCSTIWANTYILSMVRGCVEPCCEAIDTALTAYAQLAQNQQPALGRRTGAAMMPG
jgi:hypothetical protein